MRQGNSHPAHPGPRWPWRRTAIVLLVMGVALALLAPLDRGGNAATELAPPSDAATLDASPTTSLTAALLANGTGAPLKLTRASHSSVAVSLLLPLVAFLFVGCRQTTEVRPVSLTIPLRC